MATARMVILRKKGQLTIPEDVRTALGLQDGQPLWLHVDVDDHSLVLALRDPRPGRIAEAAPFYRAVSDDADRATEPSARPRRASTLRDLVALLDAGPHLSVAEADAFAADLAVARSEGGRTEGGDPWAS